MNIGSAAVPAALWRPRPGASSLRAGFPGMAALGARSGTRPRFAAVPCFSGKAAPSAVPALTTVPAMQPGQLDVHNYMTRVIAVGEGASGPPLSRAPA